MTSRPRRARGPNVANGGGLGGYQALDRKIENVEIKVEQDLVRFRGEIREDFQNFQTNIANQIKSALGNGGKTSGAMVIPLIGTAIGIMSVLGSVIGFINSDLNSSIDKVDKATTKAIEKLTVAQGTELTLRADSERRIYDAVTRVNDLTWHKDAQVEFERREDEIRDLQFGVAKDAIAALTGGLKELATNVVPKAQADQQYGALQESLTRVLAHLTQFEDRASTKFDSLERETHPYGTADVFKDLGNRVQGLQDWLFRFLTPSPVQAVPPVGKN